MALRRPPLRVSLGLLGLAFTAALVLGAWLDARATAHRAFLAETAQIHDGILQRLKAADQVSTSLGTLINSSFRVDRDQFRVFSEQVLMRHRFLLSTVYVPLVTDAERQEFEQQQHGNGFPTFAITDRRDGNYVAAGRRDRYLPLLYHEPFEPATASLIGFDLLSNPTFAQAIEYAIDTASASTAADTAHTYWLFKAIYAGKAVPEAREERRRAVNGLIALRVDTRYLLQDAVHGHEGLDATARLHTAAGAVSVVALTASGTGRSGYGRFMKALTARDAVRIHGQQLELDFTRRLHWGDLDYKLVVIAAVTGLLMSILLAVAGQSIYLRAREREHRHHEIQRQVREKTVELALEKERAQVTLASIGDGVITTDAQGRVEYLNPVAEQLTGWSAAEAHGRLLPEVFSIIRDDTRKQADSPLQAYLDETQAHELRRDSVLVDREGNEIAIDHSAAPIRDRENQIIGVVVAFHDVSHERQLAQEMSYQATHDALTGLYNRRAFEDRLRDALLDAKHNGFVHVLLYLDLDQFKIVNDAAGHVAGDELLRHVSALLLAETRRSDTVARLGGDEFGVLLHECAREEGLKIAHKIRQVVHDFRFVWKDRSYAIGVSIGMVMVNGDSDSLSTILSAADAACYAAKDKGRNRVQLFQADDAELARRRGEMQWVTRLSKALEEDRFVLYAQPIVSLLSQMKEARYEVLIRMITEEGEIVPPGAFVPAAERYLLMPDIDRWVVHSLLNWAAIHCGCAFYTINLSGESLNDDNFLAFVLEQFERTGVPPEKICFEITETAAVANLSSAMQFITALKKRGCQFSLDDFGAGWSSFAYLKNLPVDYLKIDGGFVKDMVNDPLDFAMVNSINQIGHAMGIRTVAEFAESEEILRRLAEIGVDYAQGYGIGRPRPLEEILVPLRNVTAGWGR